MRTRPGLRCFFAHVSVSLKSDKLLFRFILLHSYAIGIGIGIVADTSYLP